MFLLFGFNKGPLEQKGQKGTSQEPRQLRIRRSRRPAVHTHWALRFLLTTCAIGPLFTTFQSSAAGPKVSFTFGSLHTRNPRIPFFEQIPKPVQGATTGRPPCARHSMLLRTLYKVEDSQASRVRRSTSSAPRTATYMSMDGLSFPPAAQHPKSSLAGRK